MNINHTRDLVRMASAYYDTIQVSRKNERQDDLHMVALCTWAFVRSMKRHLSPEDEDEADFQDELYEKLPATIRHKPLLMQLIVQIVPFMIFPLRLKIFP